MAIVNLHCSVLAVAAGEKFRHMMYVSALSGVRIGRSCCSRKDRHRPIDATGSFPGVMDVIIDW
jgi:hypothetical protein